VPRRGGAYGRESVVDHLPLVVGGPDPVRGDQDLGVGIRAVATSSPQSESSSSRSTILRTARSDGRVPDRILERLAIQSRHLHPDRVLGDHAQFAEPPVHRIDLLRAQVASQVAGQSGWHLT